ncbi:alcohol-forming fatty acyl-CoA reductase-like [Rosa rugosa]|uniref:alcohol-forming fatty acyl-CoA reductase-like n=1 Tax=Rosa rugosa TaxID=74645 RepID=UPI002B4184C4|nr:alcohol-forming fatty acyl-CoA reductase-like [Rosa rugosa]
MELDSILGYLESKTILVTGATGLLGMVFVEKILRVQPNIGKLYLLIRASDANSATHRMRNEIIEKELFRVLREKWGTDFESFISKKVVAISGDVASAELGVKGFELRERMCNEIQIILHSAATVDFNDRYDIALDVNTFGVLHVLNFAKKCLKLEMLVHISTAYVGVGRIGLIPEDSSPMDELRKEITKSDLKVLERNMVVDKLNELKAQNASEKVITNKMKDLGVARSKLYGWPTTYLFTKAMAEVYLEQSKGNLPITIIRPTVVTSTYKEPFPGWHQGYRTVNSVIGTFWKGTLTCLPVDPTAVIDLIPVDMVADSIITAMVVNANKYLENPGMIYHVGTSLRNPMKMSEFTNFMFQYCTKNPWLYKDGSTIKVEKLKMFTTMAAFRSYMQIRYMLPLEGLKFLNKEFDQYFKELYVNYNWKITFAMRLAELYRPFSLYKGTFDDTNLEKLQRIARENYRDAEIFNFDPRCIDWEDYMMRTHIPGLKKHVMIKQSQSRL